MIVSDASEERNINVFSIMFDDNVMITNLNLLLHNINLK